ncbi:MAG: MarP family serine protease, partial [Acidimicrobiales bacterium]
MNILDVALSVAVVVFAVMGLRLGGSILVTSLAGFLLGFFIGALLAPPAAGLVRSPSAKATVALAVLFGTSFLVSLLARQLGVRVWRVLQRTRLAPADAGLGAIVSVAAVLAFAWLLASFLLNSPLQTIGSQIQGSTILQALNRVLPPAPSVFSRIQSFIDSEGFPQVFAQLAPEAAGPVALPSSVQVRQAAQAAGASTVKVLGQGCGQIQEGSGFVVGPGLVVTNAHVVAGIPQPYVYDTRGNRYRAVPVLFDPSFDLAVLRTRPFGVPSLQLDPDQVSRGAQAAVLGYPEDGPLGAVPAGVTSSFEAQGRDIYGRGLTLRAVYELLATVRPGNSGG